MKFAVVTVASRPTEGFQRFIRSCAFFGHWPIVLGMHQKFRGFSDKSQMLKAWLKGGKYPSDVTHILFVDSYDVVFGGSLAEIIERYEMDFPASIVFSAERGCWPDDRIRDDYPECKTPYRFLNSGGWISDIQSAIQLLNNITFDDPSDQRLLTRLYLKGSHNMVLDTECHIFQCLYQAETDLDYSGLNIVNLKTFSRPLIFHANGFSDMSKVLSKFNQYE